MKTDCLLVGLLFTLRVLAHFLVSTYISVLSWWLRRRLTIIVSLERTDQKYYRLVSYNAWKINLSRAFQALFRAVGIKNVLDCGHSIASACGGGAGQYA
jgi:hypothetical protein